MRHRLLAGLKLALHFYDLLNSLIVSMRHRLLAGLKLVCLSYLRIESMLLDLNEAPPACRIETITPF